MKPIVNIFWFRRDLRLHDNAGLYHALKEGKPVIPVFIFDRNILDELTDKSDRRVEFIQCALQEIQEILIQSGSTLDIRHGFPVDVFRQLVSDYHVEKIFTNHDYEPYARERDDACKKLFLENGIEFHSFKDHVLLEKDEVRKEDDKPYTVFTPYSRKWKSTLRKNHLHSYPAEKYFANFHKQVPKAIPSLPSLGFRSSSLAFPATEWTDTIIKEYKENRNKPGIQGTSRLGVHLRFGTISIRELAREAGALSETFVNELTWRDFYQMILWHFPRVVGQAFKPAFDRIPWRNHEKEFDVWCQGQTGYPIVDAGMRELNQTGFMHNRVRMITASFLTKHLLIDWRWGEAYFAGKLLDFDLAANNGGWQWAAGSGCDAAPYFRVFNPYLQTQKFDPQLKYVRTWVPEFDKPGYPLPIIEHEVARKRCLEVYGAALQNK